MRDETGEVHMEIGMTDRTAEVGRMDGNGHVVEHPMLITEVIESTTEALRTLTHLALSSVPRITRTDEGWLVTIEMVERKAIPDAQDLLGSYEVLVTHAGHITGYERTRVRRRIDTEERIE